MNFDEENKNNNITPQSINAQREFGSKLLEEELEEKDSEDKNLVKWIRICIASGIVIMFILFTVATDVIMKITNVVMKVSDTTTNYTANLPFAPAKKNILLIGTDSNGAGTDPFVGVRSDTLVVININPRSKNVNLLSIPRDSKVSIKGHGIDKINSAFAHGGPELTIKTIEKTLGIKIDYYIVFNYDSVKKLVTAIGGVPVYVEKDMYYTDRSGGLYVNLQKGEQILDANKAEQYLRFRKDALGDIGRMRRQQWFLKGVAQKIQSPEIITKIPDILQVLKENTKTNMSLYQLSNIAGYARTIDLNDIQIATLPGAPSTRGHISYWILDPEKTQEVVDTLIYRDNEKMTRAENQKLTVGVVYPFNQQEKAQTVITTLEDMGYEVKCTGISKNVHSQIYGHSKISKNEINKIKQNIEGLNKAQFIIAPEDYQCGKTDLTIFVSQN